MAPIFKKKITLKDFLEKNTVFPVKIDCEIDIYCNDDFYFAIGFEELCSGKMNISVYGNTIPQLKSYEDDEEFYTDIPFAKIEKLIELHKGLNESKSEFKEI